MSDANSYQSTSTVDALSAMATISVATLEERVNNHIRFFWAVFAVGCLWMSALSLALYHLNDTANQIKTAQTGLENTVTKQNVIAYSLLPPDDFKGTLPDLSSAITAARQKNIKVSTQVIGDLQGKLDASVDAPGYWPAVAEFISYRSVNNTAWVAPGNLPRCTDSPPSHATVKEILHQGNPTVISLSPGVYKNCRFDLDSPQEDEILNSFLLGSTPIISFKHCVIGYRGGAINILIALDEHDAPIGFPGTDMKGTGHAIINNTLEFDDCLFDIAFQNAPPRQGQKLTQFLLANQGPVIKLPLSIQSQTPSGL